MSPSNAPQQLYIQVGPGEMIDKITILKIKSERMTDKEQLKNVLYELNVLQTAKAKDVAVSKDLDALEAELKLINEALWQIEDDIRQCEVDKDFGDTFIQLARSVYMKNDIRAQLKKRINLLLGSSIIEEKSYVEI